MLYERVGRAGEHIRDCSIAITVISSYYSFFLLFFFFFNLRLYLKNSETAEPIFKILSRADCWEFEAAHAIIFIPLTHTVFTQRLKTIQIIHEQVWACLIPSYVLMGHDLLIL